MPPEAAGQLRLRYFAAAKAARGIGTEEVSVSSSESIDDVLERVIARSPSTALCRLVFARSTFLVNGHAETDRGRRVCGGDLLDVLPPFAGG